jgi:hypothetical protein
LAQALLVPVKFVELGMLSKISVKIEALVISELFAAQEQWRK